jgi:hypothetical protein
MHTCRVLVLACLLWEWFVCLVSLWGLQHFKSQRQVIDYDLWRLKGRACSSYPAPTIEMLGLGFYDSENLRVLIREAIQIKCSERHFHKLAGSRIWFQSTIVPPSRWFRGPKMTSSPFPGTPRDFPTQRCLQFRLFQQLGAPADSFRWRATDV